MPSFLIRRFKISAVGKVSLNNQTN